MPTPSATAGNTFAAPTMGEQWFGQILTVFLLKEETALCDDPKEMVECLAGMSQGLIDVPSQSSIEIYRKVELDTAAKRKLRPRPANRRTVACLVKRRHWDSRRMWALSGK